MILIKISLNFALLMLDDFHGGVITDGHRFLVDERPFFPMQKPDGMFIFSGLQGTSFALTVENPLYEPLHLEVQTGKANPCIIHTRLLRRNLSAFQDCDFLCGTYSPGAHVYAGEENGPPVRLQSIETQKECTQLMLVGYLLPGMARQRFFLGEKKKREVFIIRSLSTAGVYLTQAPFQRAHEQGESVVRAFHAVCAPDGKYCMPVSLGQAERIKSIGFFSKEGVYGTARL